MNPERYLGATLLNKYGITKSQWNDIFEAQGRRCDICKSTEHRGKNWNTDHNHSTGKFRGILCHSCNAMIGYARESADILRAGIDYLKHHSKEKELF